MDDKKPQEKEDVKVPEVEGKKEAIPSPSNGKSPLDEAKEVLKENKKLLEGLTEERNKIEKAVADGLINGRSFAGQAIKEPTENEKWAADAKERYAGTAMDPTIPVQETTYS